MERLYSRGPMKPEEISDNRSSQPAAHNVGRGQSPDPVLDKTLEVSPDDRSLVAWGGVLSQKSGERLEGFETTQEYALFFVNKGVLSVTIDGEPVTASQGQTLLLWPKERCVGVEPQQASLQCQWLSFAIEHSRRASKQGIIRVPRLGNVGNPDMVSELFSLLTNEYHGNQTYGQKGNPLSSQGSHHLLLSLLSRLSAVTSEKPVVTSSLTVVAERATDYIRANIDNLITTADLARALDCSEGYVRRAFRKACGCSPTDHMLNVRMARARTLLTTSRVAIGQVAQECGFTRLSYFTRVFTRMHGVTPSKYRANHSRQYVVHDL